MSHKKILILNGPNLNLLGTREPETYGAETLEQLERRCAEHGAALGMAIDSKQSNDEGRLVELIQNHAAEYDAMIVNAGAYTHTSVAIRDALLGVKMPFIEVHISNIYQRETFRHHSYLSDIAHGCIVGLGTQGYISAIDALYKLP